MRSEHAPVLVVGAGLAGLSTALFLGLHGVSAMVVDRHLSTSNQPKARGQFPTVMEALDAAGVAAEILAAAPPGKPEMTIVICETVTGRVLHSFTEGFPDFPALTPAPTGMASQQRAEAALARRAGELSARLRFRTRLESFTQDADGVRAVLRDLDRDEEYALTADYLVAADGHRGTIAQAVGIASRGRAAFGHTTTYLFAADLADRLPDTAVLMYYAQHPDLPDGAGAFVSTDTPGEYVAGLGGDPHRSDAEAIGLIRTLLGQPDVDVRLLGANTWEIAHRVADRLSAGRVHLVGDAAHLMPPTGGQGGNTAVLDGLHLAWKLAAAIQGHAGPGLLAGHSAEHLPYDRAVADWQYANMIERQRPDLARDDLPSIDSTALFFGYARPSGAFVAEDGPSEPFEDPYRPSGRPGTRAPHVVVRGSVSTRELFFRGFVLLTGDPAWVTAAAEVGARRGLRLDGHIVGDVEADPDGRWSGAYGVPRTGAVLVRPDGVVAWRTAAAPDPATLDAVLRVVLDR